MRVIYGKFEEDETVLVQLDDGRCVMRKVRYNKKGLFIEYNHRKYQLKQKKSENLKNNA